MSTLIFRAKEISVKQAEKICFINKGYHYKDVWRLIENRAAFLADKGIRKCAVVGILADNSPEWCITYMAILLLGALAAVLDTNLRADMHKEMLARVGAKAVYVSETFLSGDYGCEKYSIESIDPVSSLKTDVPVKDSDGAALFYTSGTQSKPKIVLLTHNNLVCTAQGLYKKHLEIGTGDTCLAILPLYHVYGLITGFLGVYLNGGAIFFQPFLRPADILNILKQYQITVFAAVPRIWEILFAELISKIKSESKLKYLFLGKIPLVNRWILKMFPVTPQIIGKQLRYFISGGAPFKAKYFKYYHCLGFKIVEGYGLTETTATTFCGSDINRLKPSCVGKPIEGNQVEIRNMNSEMVGEIWVKGVSVMPGYYNNAEANQAVFDEKGWFNTGDLGFLDKESDLHICGRKKNVIVLDSGKNVYPEELETFYLQSPLIAEIAVFGRQINERETVYAVVVPSVKNNDCFNKLKEEFKRMNKKLPAYKTVRKFAISYKPLPKTSLQKNQISKIIKNLDAKFYYTSATEPSFWCKITTCFHKHGAHFMYSSPVQ
jgi:long-chain acyl-CoA synthetase